MKYFDKDKIDKGKKLINVGISIIVILNFIGILADILKKDNISIKKDIIYTLIVLIVAFFYYKGNKIAFKIVSYITPFLIVLIIVQLIFGLTIYILKPFGILNIWGGGLFLIILITYFGGMFFLFIKIGWFECVEEYRLYRNESDTYK